MKQDVERVAKGLSEAQRRALVEARIKPAYMGGHDICVALHGTSAENLAALERLGLITPKIRSAVVTPLGLAVRAHLEQHHGE